MEFYFSNDFEIAFTYNLDEDVLGKAFDLAATIIHETEHMMIWEDRFENSEYKEYFVYTNSEEYKSMLTPKNKAAF